MYEDYDLLDVAVTGRIVSATVANPPMNLISVGLLEQLDAFTQEVADDPDPLVVVLRSSTPGFFICHAKYGDIAMLAEAQVPSSSAEVSPNRVHRICERLREMDKVTIAQVAGRATGGGATLAMSCDLRYGALGQAVFNSFGVPMATGLGGGATQFLPRLIGRSRAMEVILGGLDLDAATADRWGYLTRALPVDEIDAYVTHIAERIATAVPHIIRTTKALVASSGSVALDEGLREENFRLQQAIPTPEAIQGIRDFLALGGETVEGESRLESLLGDVLRASGR